MNDTPHTDTRATGPTPRKTGRGMLWALIAVVLAFLVGFFWQWYEASTVRDQLTATQAELQVERLRVRLGQATLAAQAGDFESARRQMSSFFTELQEQDDELPPQVAALADDYLTMRDEVITGLSRSNPEYAGVLYGMLEQFANTLDRTAASPATGMPTGSGERPAAPEAAPTGAADSGAPQPAAADSPGDSMP